MSPGWLTTDRETRRAARLDDPRLESVRNPKARRVLVATMCVLLVAEIVVFMTAIHTPVLLAALIAIIAVLSVFCLGALKASTRGVEELPPNVLDERQAQVRGEVYATAYKIGFALVTVELVASGLWLMLDWPLPPPGMIAAALVVTFHIGLILPTMVAAATQDV